jgi:hypothetical protein
VISLEHEGASTAGERAKVNGVSSEFGRRHEGDNGLVAVVSLVGADYA